METKIKIMRAKLKKKQNKLWLKDEIEKNKTLTQNQGNKLEIKKTKTKLKKNNIWQIVI